MVTIVGIRRCALNAHSCLNLACFSNPLENCAATGQTLSIAHRPGNSSWIIKLSLAGWPHRS